MKLAARIPAFMYLTDYREQTVKDVITQIEPELFQKVTGLTVKDFKTLCLIGLFDSEKMNQGIFGFRKYENLSLSYTGIDRHKGEAIGGWDTVLRREEYEDLYGRQQASLKYSDQADLSEGKYVDSSENGNIFNSEISKKPKYESISPKTQDRDAEIDWEKALGSVDVGTLVFHKKFGNGKYRLDGYFKKIFSREIRSGRETIRFPRRIYYGIFIDINEPMAKIFAVGSSLNVYTVFLCQTLFLLINNYNNRLIDRLIFA